MAKIRPNGNGAKAKASPKIRPKYNKDTNSTKKVMPKRNKGK